MKPTMRTTTKIAAALGALIISGGVSTAAQAAPVQPAALSPTACNGQTAGHIVKWYAPHVPYALVPLRCGSSTWGFNHIHSKHWSAHVDEDIANTLAYFTSTVPQGGNSIAFILRDLAPCEGQFRVVVQFNSYGSTGIKGIITAYHENSITLHRGEVQPAC
ncbi:hypothetical protein ACIOC1_13305 [Streptomyces sp. NPDC088197]|uniref:hypothetical protein n=1 Tax=Streptomyces sp. NPDC088197 TaxID=3365840 RepID=UPI0037F851F9